MTQTLRFKDIYLNPGKGEYIRQIGIYKNGSRYTIKQKFPLKKTSYWPRKKFNAS